MENTVLLAKNQEYLLQNCNKILFFDKIQDMSQGRIRFTVSAPILYFVKT